MTNDERVSLHEEGEGERKIKSLRWLFRLGARKWNEKKSGGGPPLYIPRWNRGRCMQQTTVPLSRLNITLYSVERRAINNVEKCAYSRALNRLFLSNSVLICHGIGRARLLRFLSKEGDLPPSPRGPLRDDSKTLHLHWTGVSRPVGKVDRSWAVFEVYLGNVNEVGTNPDCSIRM